MSQLCYILSIGGLEFKPQGYYSLSLSLYHKVQMQHVVLKCTVLLGIGDWWVGSSIVGNNRDKWSIALNINSRHCSPLHPQDSWNDCCRSCWVKICWPEDRIEQCPGFSTYMFLMNHPYQLTMVNTTSFELMTLSASAYQQMAAD